MKPTLKYSKTVIAYEGREVSAVSDRQDSYVLPLALGEEVIGRTVFMPRDNVLYLESHWAEANKAWTHVIIESYPDKTVVKFMEDTTGKAKKLLKKMKTTKSARLFVHYAMKLLSILTMCHSYIEEASDNMVLRPSTVLR